VVTVSQILGTAAMLQGYHVRGLDQTGLSQKAGPVVSDVRLSTERPQPSNKANARSVDVLIAFDQLAAAGDSTMRAIDPDRTVLVANSAAVPTGTMVAHPERPFPAQEVADRLDEASRHHLRVDAQGLVTRLLGDDSTINVFMVGVALQAGHVPLLAEHVGRAIELNGVAVDKNLRALAWGRAWVADPSRVQAAAGLSATTDALPLRRRLVDDLIGYQSARYAARFEAVVDEVSALGHQELSDAVMRNLHKLMAYKDEYEVARLLLLPESRARVEAVGGKGAKVTWHLHPPALRAMGMRNKLKLGRGSRPAFVVLRAMRRLRGTPLDLPGWANVRRVERAMIPEYVEAVRRLVPRVTDSNLAEAVAIAELPDRVRGYEQLKLERAAAYRDELARRVAAFTA
jgi:indolepyruvate ferredoxin oxidoreductase